MSRAGDAIYRALLRAFPRRFREARADEMARLFAQQRQRVAGQPLAIARLWRLAARDAIGQALRARLRSASVTAVDRHAQDDASLSSSRLQAVAQPLRDVRLAVRVLRRTPVPTLVAVIALGLGIGVNAAIVSVVHELLVDPLRYPHADRLVLPWQRRGDSQSGLRLTPRITSVDRWREAKTLDAVVVYSNTRVTLGDGGTATVVDAVRIEPALLDFTGTRVIAGRPFTSADRGKLRVHSTGARNPFGVAVQGLDRTGDDSSIAGPIEGIATGCRVPFSVTCRQEMVPASLVRRAGTRLHRGGRVAGYSL